MYVCLVHVSMYEHICKYVWTHVFFYVFFIVWYLFIYTYSKMYLCIYVYVCGRMWICLCFLLFIRIKRKCGLKQIHKVVGHEMYIIDILVCGSYGNFQDKIHLNMGGHLFCEVVKISVFFLHVRVSLYVHYLCLCEYVVCLYKVFKT